ncbi:CAP domain-containing protein [Emticicia sp. SJ17W-69]|uniref:CAP domain-containing protein n=1 Tax=Emticicia sp. SJ17W-69 TaxID=3421657 RepID=UPI003EBB8955
MKKTIAFVLISALFFTIQACSQPSEQTSEGESLQQQATPLQQKEELLQQSVLDYVNLYRKSKGLAPLQMFPLITAEALRHSQNLADEKIAFGHDGFDGRAKRIMSQITGSNAIAENVAYGKFTAQEVVNRWIQSPGHRQNIEGKYTLTGVGIVRRNDGYLYFTQIFINK